MAEELYDSDEVMTLTTEIRDLKVEKRVKLLTFQLTIVSVGTFLVIALLVWGLKITAAPLVLGLVVFGKYWTDFRVTSCKLSEVSHELEVLRDTT